jgi:hypothetical protein
LEAFLKDGDTVIVRILALGGGQKRESVQMMEEKVQGYGKYLRRRDDKNGIF